MQHNLHYTFSVEHAEKYGLNEAIMLHNFIYWLKINEANNNNYINGKYWTYNSSKAFAKLFPFWTQKQIEYTLSKMVNMGILIKDCFNEDKRDRTAWYTLADSFFSNCISEKKEMEVTNLGNDISEKKEIIYITDKKQQIKNTNKNNIDTASGFSLFEDFWKDWLEMCKEKGSPAGEKKSAKAEYKKALKIASHDDIMKTFEAFKTFMLLTPTHNKHACRWFESIDWKDFESAIENYNTQAEILKQPKKENGKTSPVQQKAPEISQEEVKMMEDIKNKRNAIIEALKPQEKDFMVYIKKVLKNYYLVIHHDWIDDFVFAMKGETAYFGFSRTVYLTQAGISQEKFEQIIMRELKGSKTFKVDNNFTIKLKLID